MNHLRRFVRIAGASYSQQRVQKHLAGGFEGDTVFPEIGFRFLGVPLER